MPILDNPRYEAFAAARADGAHLDDAYEDAGFVADFSNARRLARRPEVAARLAELRAARADAPDSSPLATVAALMRLAGDPKMLERPAALREARQTLLEAHRLREATRVQRRVERRKLSFHNDLPKGEDDQPLVDGWSG